MWLAQTMIIDGGKMLWKHTKSDNIILQPKNKFSRNVNEKLFKYRMNTALFELIFKEIVILH